MYFILSRIRKPHKLNVIHENINYLWFYILLILNCFCQTHGVSIDLRIGVYNITIDNGKLGCLS